MRRRLNWAWLAACALGAAHAAPNTALPVHVEADQVELNERESLSVYHGHVRVTQGQMTLTARRVTVQHEGGKVRKVMAEGSPAEYRQQAQGAVPLTAQARHMVYEPAAGRLTLLGAAALQQGANRLTSERIVYDTASERVVAGTVGHGRVQITLEPAQTPQPAVP